LEFRDLLLGLVLVWLSAKVAGEGMERIGQTAVLGELLAGWLITHEGRDRPSDLTAWLRTHAIKVGEVPVSWSLPGLGINRLRHPSLAGRGHGDPDHRTPMRGDTRDRSEMGRASEGRRPRSCAGGHRRSRR